MNKEERLILSDLAFIVEKLSRFKAEEAENFNFWSSEWHELAVRAAAICQELRSIAAESK